MAAQQAQTFDVLYRRAMGRNPPPNIRDSWQAAARPERRAAYLELNNYVGDLEALRDLRQVAIPLLRDVVAADTRALAPWARYPAEFHARYAATQPARDRLAAAQADAANRIQALRARRDALGGVLTAALGPPVEHPTFMRLDRYAADPRVQGRFVRVQRMRVYGELNRHEIAVYQSFIGRSVANSLPYDDPRMVRLAEASDFESLLNNIQSETGRFVVLRVEAALVNRRGAFDLAGVRLLEHPGRFQPHIVHDLLEGGAPICRPEFFREGACLINLFLETFADSINARLVRPPHKDLSHERLYELATEEEAPAEGPLPVSLEQAVAWARKWRIPFHAVSLQGELVHRWRPADEGLLPNSNLKKGPSVWRVIVHDRHAFTVPRDWSAEQRFDAIVATQEPSYLAENRVERRHERHRQALEGTLGQDLPCAKLWHHPGKPEPLTADDCAVVDCANDVIQVLEDEARKGVRMAITGAEPDELVMDLWAGGFEPKITQMKFGAAEAFVVQMGRRTLYVRRAVDGETRGDQPCVREDFTLESQSQLDEALFRLRETVMPRNALSRYSPAMAQALRAYKRGAPVGLLCGGAPTEGRFVGVDFRRAYTADLMGVREVPVFSPFDEPRPYEGQPIEPTSYYLVRTPPGGRDGIIFADEHDGIWGETVLFAREEGLPFEIVGVCKPHRVVRLGGSARAEVRRLYESGLPDGICKTLANITYGLANKHQTSKQQGRLFLGEEEALSVSSRVMPYGRGFLALLTGRRELEEGYLPVARLVLDQARRNLYRLRKALAGLGPVAVRTDCCYVPEGRAGEVPAALAAAGLAMDDPGRRVFDNIGRCRLEAPKGADLLPRKPLGPRKNDDARVESFVKHAPAFEDLEMADEWDDEEATRLYGPSAPPRVNTPADIQRVVYNDSRNEPAPVTAVDEELDAIVEELSTPDTTYQRRLKNLLIVAKYPGAGKSSLSKRYARRHGEVSTTLFVCPTNDLRDELLMDGFRACTTHTLVGRTGGVGVDGAKTPLDVTGVRRIVYEEVFLQTTVVKSWIAKYVRSHPEIAFVANGGALQNEPVGEQLVHGCLCKRVAYASSCLASVFPRRLTLKIPKRVLDPEQREVMQRLCDGLSWCSCREEEAPPISEVLKDLLRVAPDEIDWRGEHAHIVGYRSTATRVNAAAHQAINPEQGLTEFRVGDVLRGASGGCRCRGGRINSSALYEVLEVGETHIKVRGRDGKVKEPTVAAAKKALVRPHARTCHSAQGSSIDGRIHIHDWNTPMATRVWLRTAISRSTTCDVVLVDALARRRYPAAGHIAARIANHRATDAARGMAFEEEDYVTPGWAREQFRRQAFACAGCQEPIDGETDWSIDRAINALPHTQDNCSLVCRRCQNASGHRERQQDAAQTRAEDLA